MLHSTKVAAYGWRLYARPHQFLPMSYFPVSSVFPLIYSNNLLPKIRNNTTQFAGRQAFDGCSTDSDGACSYRDSRTGELRAIPGHALPVTGSRGVEYSTNYRFTERDYLLNPQLITTGENLIPTPDYVGTRTGMLFPGVGWRKPGCKWSAARSFYVSRRGGWCKVKPNVADEKITTPRYLLAPRIGPEGPQARYEGKLCYSKISLSRLLSAIHKGFVNPNEVITLKTLLDAKLISRRALIWPGVKLTIGNFSHILGRQGQSKSVLSPVDRRRFEAGVDSSTGSNEKLKFSHTFDSHGAPIPRLRWRLHIELQRADRRVIKIIEKAGGTFTATYLSPEGLYQEVHPEKFPTFIEQDFPNRIAMEAVSSVRSQRGFLARWTKKESMYAHPESGRRLSHYVRPPMQTDFPSSASTDVGRSGITLGQPVVGDAQPVRPHIVGTATEYDDVKKYQKWHLNQSGATGTILPWHNLGTVDLHRSVIRKL